jgi:hypothetical protein
MQSTGRLIVSFIVSKSPPGRGINHRIYRTVTRGGTAGHVAAAELNSEPVLGNEPAHECPRLECSLSPVSLRRDT